MAKRYPMYGVFWDPLLSPLERELICIRKGGSWRKTNGGGLAGKGMYYHWRKAQEILWPEKVWHKWNILQTEAYLKYRYIAELGCAASGKSDTAGTNVLLDWYCFPGMTTVIVSSTEIEALEMRVWGMIKKYHRLAKQRFPWLPGHLIESRRRIVFDKKTEAAEGRDFRNGLVGVACKKGQSFVGLGCFAQGTMVDTPEGQKPIETIQAGDMVLNATGISVVSGTSKRLAPLLLRLRLSNGKMILCTPEHPILTEDGWSEARHIRPETKLVPSDKALPKTEWPQLKSAETHNSFHAARVFNLEVQDHPSYSVEGVLVHNSYVGIHNTRVILLADELSLMPRALLDSISNLSKAPRFKMIGLGNPKDPTDALGVLGEPAVHLGGWEGNIDQQPGTKQWETKFPKGICLQLPASDTPNNSTEPGKPWLYPFLVTPEQVRDDITIWGKDSLHFTMMSEAKMPRGQVGRRIITRQACLKFHAFEEAVWQDNRRTRIGFCDPAYRGVGGDRCIFGEMQFGEERKSLNDDVASQFINQEFSYGARKTILALIDMMLVPVNANIGGDLPEDQIALFIKDQCEQRGIPPEHMFFDSTGRGSLASAFGRLWSPHVVGIEFGGKASERNVSQEITVRCCDYYYNMVTELWYSVRLIIESEQMRGLTEEVVRELSMREWKTVSNNKIQVETKEEMKIKSGRSPDLADALVVGCEGARRLGFVIRKATSAVRRLESKWKKEIEENAKKAWHEHDLNYAT